MPSDAHAAATEASQRLLGVARLVPVVGELRGQAGLSRIRAAASASANRRCRSMRSPGSRSAATTSVIRPCRSR